LNCLRAPALIHYDLTERLGHAERECSRLVEQIAQPNISAHEERQRTLVLEKMADLTPEEAHAIEALVQHGETERGHVSNLGIPVDLFSRAADKGMRVGLVKERQERHGVRIQQLLSINPEFKSALQHYFTHLPDHIIRRRIPS
jgi:hypothetical protein